MSTVDRINTRARVVNSNGNAGRRVVQVANDSQIAGPSRRAIAANIIDPNNMAERMRVVRAAKLQRRQHRNNPIECATAEPRIVPNQNVVAQPALLIQQSMDKPKFTGKELNPVQFLKKFHLYAANAQWSDAQMLIGVRGCLTDSAAAWAELMEAQWVRFEDFVMDFNARYWSDEIQCTVRGKLESDRWQRKGHPEMATHFVEYVIMAKALTPPLTESQIVSTVMKHFPFSVQTGWMSPGNKTVSETMDYLMKQDQMYKRARPDGNQRLLTSVNAQEIENTEGENTRREHSPDDNRQVRRVKPYYRNRRDFRRPQRKRSPDRERKSTTKASSESSGDYSSVPPPSGNGSKKSPGKGSK